MLDAQWLLRVAPMEMATSSAACPTDNGRHIGLSVFTDSGKRHSRSRLIALHCDLVPRHSLSAAGFCHCQSLVLLRDGSLWVGEQECLL